MRKTTLLALVLLSTLAACDTATEPASLAPDHVVRATADVGGVTYTAELLPQGDITGMYQTYLHIDGTGAIYGSVWDDAYTRPRAARWTIEADGSVSSPVLLGDLPAPFDDDQQTVQSSNGAGMVVGYSRDPVAGLYAGWVYFSGAMKLLRPIPDGDWIAAVPYAASGNGTIAGQVGRSGGGGGAAVWLPPYDSDPVLLPKVDGYSLHSARQVTDDGRVIGWARGSGVPDVMVEWQIDSDGSVLSGPTLLENGDSFLPGRVSSDLDAACADHHEDSADHIVEACLYRVASAEQLMLGFLDGYPHSWGRGVAPIAADGSVDVVGIARGGWGLSDPELWDEARAVFWSIDSGGAVSGPYDLGVPDPWPNNAPPNRFEFAGAYSVEVNGRVVGYADRADGSRYATLWRPDSSDGGSDDGGDGGDCIPRGNGNNCK